MKKILLASLVLLSPQIFAEDVILQCKESGSERFTKLLKIGNPFADIYTANYYEGKINMFFKDYYGRLSSSWADTKIFISYGSSHKSYGVIDRQTLEYLDGKEPRYGEPDTRKKYACEVNNYLDEVKKQLDAEAKARREAEKAKNVI